MPKYAVTMPDGQSYEVNSDRELSDAEAHQYAVQQTGGGGGDEKPGFWQSLWDTVNPVNTVKSVAHGVSQYVQHPYDTGLAYLEDQARNPLRGSPLTLGAGYNAGKRIGSGDVRGGLGEAVGDLLNTALPLANRAAGPVGRATSAFGRTTEALGDSNALRHAGSYGALAETLYRGDPLGGAVLAATPAVTRGGGRVLQRVGKAIEGLSPNAADAASVDRYMPNQSATLPGEFYAEPAEAIPSALDRYMPNTSGAGESLSDIRSKEMLERFAKRHAEILGRTADQHGMPSVYEQPSSAASSTGRASAEAENITHNSPYGEGALIPSNVKPTELQDPFELASAAESGAKYPTWDSTYGGVVPEFTHEAGNPDIPGLTIDSTAPAAGAGSRNVPYTSPTSRTVDLDQYFGPGATDLQGRAAQAAPLKSEEGFVRDLDPSHQIYDPQTDSDYLRQLLDAAPDQPTRDFYSKALDQRNRIGLAVEGMRRPSRNLRLLDVKPFDVPLR